MRKQGNKSLKRKETNMSEYLPEEVISEILCRLPVKSILQCRCVCKLWSSLIKHPDFITAHLQKTTLSSSNPNTNHFFLIDIYGQYSLHFDNQDFEQYMQLRASFPSFYTHQFQVAGSCNGVICCLYRNHGYKVVLYNPYVRKILSLPNFGITVAFNHSNFMGFGYCSRSHDYKVLRILISNYEPRDIRAELYSLNLNSWKDITQITPNHVLSEFATRAVVQASMLWRSTHVNGSLYWIATQRNSNQFRNLIMVFDVNDEIFHEIPLPECIAQVDSSSLYVYQLRELEVAVVYQQNQQNCYAYQSDIWVMKEYGVVESWVKLATVGKHWRGRLRVMGFRNNGELLIAFQRGMLASQKLNSQRVKNLMALPNFVCHFYRYVESIVLLDKENDRGTGDTSGSSDEKLPRTCN